MKIFLTGFMGSGKTYLGKALANSLGFRFLDLDEWLETEEGKTISQIFSESGETEFRKLEAEYLRKTAWLSNSVIATGGGTPCFHENMEWMNSNGVTIFLNASPELISLRLAKEKAKRPLLNGMADEDLTNFIEKKMAERVHFYHQASLQLEIFEDDNSAINELSGYLRRFLIKT